MSRRVSLPGIDALFPRGERGKAAAPPEEVERTEAGPADTATGQEASMQAKQEEKPQKFTFYFEPDTLEALDEAWFRMRRRLGSRVSKSAIVDCIVRDAVKDLNRLEKLLTASP